MASGLNEPDLFEFDTREKTTEFYCHGEWRNLKAKLTMSIKELK